MLHVASLVDTATLLSNVCLKRKLRSKTSKLATSNSTSKISLLQKSDLVDINLLGGDVKGSNLTKSLNNNPVERERAICRKCRQYCEYYRQSGGR